MYSFSFIVTIVVFHQYKNSHLTWYIIYHLITYDKDLKIKDINITC